MSCLSPSPRRTTSRCILALPPAFLRVGIALWPCRRTGCVALLPIQERLEDACPADPPEGDSQGVAIDDDEVGRLANLERAGLVLAVVDVSAAGRVRGQQRLAGDALGRDPRGA